MKLIEFPKDETNDLERLSQFMDKVKLTLRKGVSEGNIKKIVNISLV